MKYLVVQETVKKDLDKKVLSYIMPFIIISVLNVVNDLIYRIMNNMYISQTVGGVFCSLLILYSIYLVIYSISNNSVISVCIVSGLNIVLNVINQIKIMHMKEPVYLSDIGYLNNVGETFGMINNIFINTIKTYIPIAIIIVVITIITIYLFTKKELLSKLNIDSIKIRGGVLIGSIVVLLLLFVPTKTTNKIYLNMFFGANNIKSYESIVSNVDYYSKYGVISGIYGQYLKSNIHEPDNYDEQQLKEVLNQVNISTLDAESKKSNIGKPNIVVILSESFFDISVLDEIKFDKQVAPNFNKFKNEGILFDMISPVYGGTTANAEMQLLAGFNHSYYTKGFIPYLHLYNKNKTTPSIIAELENNGYKTSITTCTSDRFYNREQVYSSFGIDERIYLTDVEEKYYKGQYISDEYLTDRIIEQLQNKKENEKLFTMTLTIQQHMPYTYEKYDKYDIGIEESNLDEKMEETVLAYAQGVYDADKELGRLNEYIQSFDEPTIIVFFGDHLPHLNTYDGVDIFKKLNYFNTQDELLNSYRKYNTQALVLANYEIEDEGIKYLSPDLLMPYLLNRMDIKLSSYYKFLDNTKNILPSYNYSISMDKEGNLFETKKLNDDMKKQYLLREKLQYMLYIK